MDYALKNESLVCFAGEDWWYHHPHSKNHILKRLAKQNRVLFVNSIGMGLPRVSNPDFLLKIGRKLRSYSRWLSRAPEGPFILTPISLPFYESMLARKLNRTLLRFQLRVAMRLCGMRTPILWVAIPFAADLVDVMDPKVVLYQVSDKYDANQDSAVSRDVIRDFDRRMKQRAALILYSGKRLFDEAEVDHRYLLEQAVDFDHFATQAAMTAHDIASIPRPTLAYMGWIDYLIDTDLIERVAKERPHWHWVFVGRRSNHVRISKPNVHFLGPKPYAELPTYLRHVDVCVVPWKTDHAFASYGSAIKVREYLATGKPVVMSPLYEYKDTPGIRTYKTPEEFIAVVEDALQNDSAELKRIRQDAVRLSTWDVRTQQLSKTIVELLSNKGRSAKTGTVKD